MKKINNKICILLCLLIALALGNVQPVNASPSLGITLTLYSNSNNKKDTGHAWISITNNTKGTINIGPYSVKRGQCVYIDARGNAEHIFASSQDKRKGDFNGRTYINYISMASSVYKSYAYVSKDITFEDLDMIFYKMKNYQTYDLLANNCTNFAKDIWNSVKNKSKSISKSFTGIEAPQALKDYILNKMGGKSGSNIKGSSDCYFVTPLGNLIPYTIPTVTGFQGKRNGNTATFTWNGIRKEIGANQYNITGYQIEYTDTASKSTKTVNVSGTKTSASINGLNPSRNYVFKVRGICDYSSQGNGSFNVGDFSNSVTLRGNSTKKASLKLNKSKISMYITESTKVKATASGKSKKVTWKSSNSKIATVKNGVITAKKTGSVTITASCNGVKKTCRVTVKGDWYQKVLRSSASYKIKGAFDKNTYTISRNDFYEYRLFDINKDGIKELMLYKRPAAAVFTYYKGKVVPLAYSSFTRSICLKGKYFTMMHGTSSENTCYVFTLKNGKLHKVGEYFHTTSSAYPVPIYKINGKNCSKTTFFKTYDKYMKNATYL